MTRKSHRIILCSLEELCTTYTSWEALARATGWNANSLRVLWHKTKDKVHGMKYRGYKLYRCEDNRNINLIKGRE